MKVVIVAATEKEIELIRKLPIFTDLNNSNQFEISFLISGVGLLASCFSIAELIFNKKPNLIVQVGIAGSFDPAFALGSVVAVQNEYLGDAGVVENNMLKDLFDLGLQGPDDLPFIQKKLANIYLEKWNITFLAIVDSITINEITTSEERILQLKEKYTPSIESMEGASLHYCCLKTGTPFYSNSCY